MRKPVTAVLSAALTLCLASPVWAHTASHATAHKAASSNSPYLQCVTFVRQVTGMQIFGDAWTWWEKATNKYDEGHAPKPGSVLVFRSQGKMKLGHVAVVSQVITDRYIQVNHANWSPVEGHRGRVEENVNVLDVSERGDWSKVKVWYGPLNDLGTTVYSTYGFIYQAAKSGQNMGQQLVAQMSGDRDQVRTQPVTQVALAQTAPAALPDDLKSALTPETSRPAVHAVTVSAQVTGTQAAQLVAQLNPGHTLTPADVQGRGRDTLVRP